MNKCFLIGKVLDEPIFKFFYRNKHTSICYFHLKVNDSKSTDVFTIFALDNNADYILQKVHVSQQILVQGMLYSNESKISILSKSIKIL